LEETDIKESEKAVAGQCGRWTGNKYSQLKEFCGPNRMEEKDSGMVICCHQPLLGEECPMSE